MQDLIGRTLGHYRVVEKIGAGGMGEVYRAHDERLDRDVAIKTILEPVARDEQRMARFEREAKLLASLSHQNIATLHGLEEHEGRHFLVMELAEGETLADRIERGPVPIDEALDWAKQIAEGLDAAHEKNIVHRDLKPANVMLSPEGHIKILDFGLAKAWHPESSDVDINESPTLTAGMTRTGTLLGTAAYMSPEQARGKAVDKRTDIFAFGCVLYELLARQRAFQGSDASQVAAAILRDEPDWGILPPAIPGHIPRLLARCLVKRPRDRLHDIADARIELQSVLNAPVATSDVERPLTAMRAFVRTALPWIVVGAALAAAVGWIAPARRTLTELPGAAKPSPLTRFAIDLRGEQRVGVDRDMPLFTISADGSRIAWLGGEGPSRRIFTRAMDDTEIRVVPGTEGATNQCILLSPDGHEVSFARDDTLWVIPVTGGQATPILERIGSEHRVWSGDWGPDGTIVIQTKDGLRRITPGGGAAEILSSVNRVAGEPNHWNPRFLADAGGLVYSVAAAPNYVEMLDFATGERHRVLDEAILAWVLPTGHLLFGRDRSVFAVSFDRENFETVGAAVPVLLDVEPVLPNLLGPQLDIATDGSIVYMPAQGATDRTPTWVSRDGEIEVVRVPQGRYNEVHISPDGTKVASVLTSWPTGKIVIVDLNRGVRESVAAGELEVSRIAWSPDESRIAYAATSRVRHDMYVQSVGGGKPTQLLDGREKDLLVEDWSPDGDFLLYSSGVPGASCQDSISLLPLGDGSATSVPIVSGSACVGRARFSPDGRWIAYVSDEDGLAEVYIREVGPGQMKSVRKHKISRSGGWDPVWSPTGEEVFFRSSDGKSVLSVPIRLDPALDIEEETVVLEDLRLPQVGWAFSAWQFDVSPDGSRFLMAIDSAGPESLRLVVVRDWFEELERLVPTD